MRSSSLDSEIFFTPFAVVFLFSKISLFFLLFSFKRSILLLVRYSFPNFMSGLIPSWLKTIFSSSVRSTVIIFFSFEFNVLRSSFSLSFEIRESSLLRFLGLSNSFSVVFSGLSFSVDWKGSKSSVFILFDLWVFSSTFLFFKIEISKLNWVSTKPVPLHSEHFLPNNSYIFCPCLFLVNST